MNIGLILIIILHLLIYSLPSFLGGFLQKRDQIILNYTFLGVLFALIQLFDGLYAVIINNQYSINGGDIAYSALIFTALYLIISQPEPKVSRKLIYIFIVHTFFLYLLFKLLSVLLISGYVINYHEISSIFLNFSFKSLLFSLVLFSTEIMLILFLFRGLISKIESRRSIIFGLGLIYLGTVIIDGVLYPLGMNLFFGNSNLSIINGVIAKFIFGIGFGILLMLLLEFQPEKLSKFQAIQNPILEYLLPPRKLKAQLKEAEEELKKLKQIIPICSWCKQIRDDQGYWDQLEKFISENSDFVFSHGVCPSCAIKLS